MKIENLIIISVLILSGCGVDTASEQTVVSNKDLEITSSDLGIKAIKSELNNTTVEATSSVGKDVVISKMLLLNNNNECNVINIDGLSFDFYSNDIGECRYEYIIKPENTDLYDGESRSIVRFSVSETAQENTLTSINKNTDIDTEVVIDIETELNSELNGSEYYIIDDLTIIGSGSAIVDDIENTITYTPENIGITEIMYSMSDGKNTLLGSIYVSVSDTENTPPTANSYRKEGTILKGTMIEVGLSDFISDEEDEVRLDAVKAYNANVSITSSVDHTFTFESEVPGGHEVTYTVSDGRGGYAVAQVYIEVEADFSLIQDWEDITIHDPYIDSDITFTAPMSKVMADYSNINYSTTETETGINGPIGAEVIKVTLEQAKDYCSIRNGRLPISRELDSLLELTQNNVYKSNNWPTTVDYWSADKNSSSTNKVYSFSSPNTASSDSLNDNNYVTCVMLDKEEIKEFYSEVEITYTGGVDYSLLIKAFDPDGNIAPYQVVNLNVPNKRGVFHDFSDNISEVTDTGGTLNEIYHDTSLSNAVLNVNMSSTAQDSFPLIVSNYSDNMIDVRNDSLWNSVDTLYDRDIRDVHESNGLPMLYFEERATEITRVYKSPFRGGNFIAKEVIKVDGDGSNQLQGKINFVIQQYSNSPNVNEWGYHNGYQEGIPHSNAVISTEINYFSQQISAISGNYYKDINETKSVYLTTRYDEWYLWYMLLDGDLLIYSNTIDERPEQPFIVLSNAWGVIDPSSNYWVGFGSTNSSSSNTIYVSGLFFSNF